MVSKLDKLTESLTELEVKFTSQNSRIILSQEVLTMQHPQKTGTESAFMSTHLHLISLAHWHGSSHEGTRAGCHLYLEL